jgi:undecaprenyl-diphosphatase
VNLLPLVIVLGIIEGLTEFLPVSSTGHLVIAGRLLGFTDESSSTFLIFIQLGAILAVVVLFWRRFLDLIPAQLSFILPRKFIVAEPELGGNTTDDAMRSWSGLVRIGAGCFPVFTLGLFARDAIKSHLMAPVPVAWALIVGGIVMIMVDRDHRATAGKRVPLEKISIAQAVCIGLFQCFSLWPGISRSGATIIGGLAVGLNRKAAAEFSFFVAVPVMVVATTYELLKSINVLDSSLIVPFAIGFIVSFIVAILAIRSFISFVTSFSMFPFGIYRIIVGAVILIW